MRKTCDPSSMFWVTPPPCSSRVILELPLFNHSTCTCYALLFPWWLHLLFIFLKGLKMQMWSKNFHTFWHQHLHVCLPSTVLQSLRGVALASENNPLLRQWVPCLQLLKVIAPTVSYHLLTHVFRFSSMDRCPKWLSVLWLVFLIKDRKKILQPHLVSKNHPMYLFPTGTSCGKVVCTLPMSFSSLILIYSISLSTI